MEEETTDAQKDKMIEDYQSRLSSIELDVPLIKDLAAKKKPAIAEPPQPKRSPEAALPELPQAVAAPEKAGEVQPHVQERIELPSWADARAAFRKPWLRRAAAAAAFLAASALALNAAARWQARRELRSHQSFALPLARPAGLSVNGGILYTLDPARQLIFAFTASGSRLKIKAIEKFPVPADGGLAFGKDCLWSADTQSGRIFRHSLDPAYSVQTTFANPQSHPSAVYWDGRRLWTSDARTQTVFQYAVDRALTPLRQYTLSGISPAGMHLEGETLWVFDSLKRAANTYSPGGILAARETIDFNDRLPANCRVTGFAADEASAWIITENPAEIHRFDLQYLKRKANIHGTAP
ncbi:MAG: hypothetical protein HY922_11670 [Elusimicrobia bacterium]|nr:hypothetical protein [Elusimicrobiota bacterium]